MTIEAQDCNSIWLRCATGTGDVILMQIDANTGNLLIDAYHPEADDAECTLTIPPAEALALGHMLIAMASRQLQAPIEPQTHPDELRPLEERGEASDQELQRRMSTTILEAEPTIRTFNALERIGVIYLGDVAKMSENELKRTPNIGRKSLSEIKDILFNHGLSLGLDVSSWKRPSAVPAWHRHFKP